MSKVKLGTINFSVPTQEINYYLGAILSSESGFLTPELIQNSNYYQLIYGDFPYIAMYERLIKVDDLPSVVLPLLTPKSKYNRTSIRLFNENDLNITYAHPRYDESYSIKSSNPSFQYTEDQLEKGQVTFTSLIDLSNVLTGGSFNSEGYFILSIGRYRYCFRTANAEIPSNEYYVEAITIDDYLDLIHELTTLGIDVKTQSNETFNSINQSWTFEVGGAVIGSFDPRSDEVIQGLDITGREAYEIFLENLWTHELFTIKIEDVINLVKDYVDNLSGDLVKSNLITNITSQLSNNKILATYPDISINCIEYIWDGLYITESFNANQDELCSRLEGSKIADFYSKVKGPQGANLTLSIAESVHQNCWDITIDLGILSESFTCYSIKDEYTPNEAIDIRLLGKYSKLVDVKIYDYEVTEGQDVYRIDQMDYLELFGSYDDYDPNNVIPIVLPTVTNLQFNRLDPEVLDEDSYKYSLRVLNESEYHPDLFLVTDLMYDDQIADVYSYVRGDEYPSALGGDFGDVTHGFYSQALIKLSKKDISIDLPNSSNRLLYFYEDFKIDGELYPMFYPYIPNIIEGTLLDLDYDDVLNTIEKVQVDNLVIYNDEIHELLAIVPYKYIRLDNDVILREDQVIGNIELGSEITYYSFGVGTTAIITEIIDDHACHLSGIPFHPDLNDPDYQNYYNIVRLSQLSTITPVLDSRNINYLHYDNLSYYYPNLFETGNMSKLFISQFDCSKVSRAFLEWGRNLITSNQSNYISRIDNVIDRLRSCMPYVSSITYTSELTASKLSIHTTLTMQRLINKVFTINFELNLT